MITLLSACNSVEQRQDHNGSVYAEAVRDSCDDPDANIECCFTNMSATLSPVMRISKVDDQGEALLIQGRIVRGSGDPLRNAILYAYHTDHSGLYSKKGDEIGAQKWHGRHHGWCRTDSLGRFEIHSIRPAPYPDNTMPAHIHCAIKESSGRTYYINDIVFSDDPLVNEEYVDNLTLQGGSGIVELKKNDQDIWMGSIEIEVQ